MSNIKSDIKGLKDKIQLLENNLDSEIVDIQKREEKWILLDEEVNYLINNKHTIVKFNVSGTIFATKIETLLKVKDSLFYKMVLSGKINLESEIYIDRSNKLFSYILDYLRYLKINYSRFSKEELYELKAEADFYELNEISAYLSNVLIEPIFVNFSFSGPYLYNNSIVGTNSIDDISNSSSNKGICAKSPGFIIFELNKEIGCDKLEIRGYQGNTTAWAPSNGSGAIIYTSKDNIEWARVGVIPASFATLIAGVILQKTRFKYLKFEHTSYLGIGYLKLVSMFN